MNLPVRIPPFRFFIFFIFLQLFIYLLHQLPNPLFPLLPHLSLPPQSFSHVPYVLHRVCIGFPHQRCATHQLLAHELEVLKKIEHILQPGVHSSSLVFELFFDSVENLLGLLEGVWLLGRYRIIGEGGFSVGEGGVAGGGRMDIVVIDGMDMFEDRIYLLPFHK